MANTFPMMKALAAVINAYEQGSGPDVKYAATFQGIKNATEKDPFVFSQFGVTKDSLWRQEELQAC